MLESTFPFRNNLWATGKILKMHRHGRVGAEASKMAPHVAGFRTLGPSRRRNVDIEDIVQPEVVENQNSALLAAHRRWVARSR